MIVVAVVIAALALAALAALAFLAAWLTRLIRKHGAVTVLWRFLSGQPLDGVPRTNATFTMPSRGPRPVLHPTGHAVRWHHWTLRRRLAIRIAVVLASLASVAGFILAPLATGITLAVAAIAGLGDLVWRAVRWVRTWRHKRHYVRPLEGTLVRKIPIRPLSIDVQRDGDIVKAVDITWPAETELDAADQQATLAAVTARLAIEAPNAAWKLKGRDRSVRFTPCDQPPPSDVSWDDVAAAITSAAPSALVFGMGVRNAISKVTYSESPHIAIPGPSGGGKSNLAACLLLQEMLRGSLIFNLDPKWISHLWLQDLPNVINAHEVEALHEALSWLGRELLRRTKAAYASAGGTGRVRGNVGPRIIVVCEELNYGMPDLKNYWREIRTKEDPKRSPALAALSALSCAGRASDMHELLIAQMLTAESTGVSDSTVRSNAGIKAMVRPDAPGWNMVVGKHIPMPPQGTAPGRIQLVTGQTVRETQVPYLHLDDKDEAVADKAVEWARALAVSGAVAKIPIGGEYGVPLQLVPACVLGGAEAGCPVIEAGQGPETAKTRPNCVSEREALKLSTILERGLINDMDAGDVRDVRNLRKWSTRYPDFPKEIGMDGPAHTYDPEEVVAWVENYLQTRANARQGMRVVS